MAILATDAPAQDHGPDISGFAVDRAILGEWLGNDEAAIDALLVIFRDSVLTDRARLESALTRGDLKEYAKTAHRLRGAALSMGAHALATICAALDHAARIPDEVSCRAGMGELNRQVTRMIAEVAS